MACIYDPWTNKPLPPKSKKLRKISTNNTSQRINIMAPVHRTSDDYVEHDITNLNSSGLQQLMKSGDLSNSMPRGENLKGFSVAKSQEEKEIQDQMHFLARAQKSI